MGDHRVPSRVVALTMTAIACTSGLAAVATTSARAGTCVDAPASAAGGASGAWIATPGAEHALSAISEVLQNRFGSPTKSDPLPNLRAGLIGAASDDATRTYFVVVDASIDQPSLQRELSTHVAAESPHSQPPFGIRVVQACHTSAALVQAASVLAARDWHPDAGRTPYAYHLSPVDSRFVVTFAPGNEEVGQALEAKLGDLVSVTYEALHRLSRGSDIEPHWGGAGIHATNFGTYNDCSSGFTVVLTSGLLGSVTAEHCYSDGWDLNSGSEYYGHYASAAPFPLYDMGKIQPYGETFTNTIWATPTTTYRVVTAKNDPNVGGSVCLSGMVTGNVCNVSVTSTSSTFCDDQNNCTPDLAVLQKNGTVIGHDGDSGGPAYWLTGTGTASIRGMIVGGTGTTSGDTTVYIEKTSSIEIELGVQVYTG